MADMRQILAEAKSRWLRPTEISTILRNYRRFNITPDPPNLPPGGSLFIFDRKALRYFRKDGHQWKKKKDGKTVREAHEKLKAGSIDILHCYYAHGEDDDNFQRRCYWLLDGQLEHIVLVHYRDVKEETSSSDPQLLSKGPTSQGAETSSVADSAHINASTFVNPSSYAPITTNVNWSMPIASSEFEGVDLGNDLTGVPFVKSVPGSGLQVASLPGNSITGPISALTGSSLPPYTAGSMNTERLNRSINHFFLNQVTSLNLIPDEGQNVQGTSHAAGSFGFQFNDENSPSTRSGSHSLKQKLTDTAEQNFSLQQLSCTDALSTRSRDSIAQNEERIKFSLHDDFNVLPEPYSQPLTVDDIIQVEEENAGVADHSVEDCVSNDSVQRYEIFHDNQLDLAPPSDLNEQEEKVPTVFKNSLGMDIYDNDPGGSFERWMDKELGNDCSDILMASDSCSNWNAIDTQNDKVFSGLSRHIQLDVDSVTPLLSQEQLFSIDDFSPDWAYSGDETKVCFLVEYNLVV
ncbi:Calmodulin-binding transcription activator 2 [Dendrobium catenatum]|uniref:Calmodulin-binding transcription activator 2 n=1 Tax=Dendrobium catenatum TaxID=906689 RepID=A0A2I0WW02_9ASPA|nr:Calmodulin-binding transcription activator 2 [Dendrobium catenatum]